MQVKIYQTPIRIFDKVLEQEEKWDFINKPVSQVSSAELLRRIEAVKKHIRDKDVFVEDSWNDFEKAFWYNLRIVVKYSNRERNLLSRGYKLNKTHKTKGW